MLPERQQHCPLLLTGSAAPPPLLLVPSLLATTLHSLLHHSATASPSPALTPPLPLPRYILISIFFSRKRPSVCTGIRKTEALGIISIQVYFERDELDHDKADY